MLYVPFRLRYEAWNHQNFDSADYLRLFKQMAAMTDRENWIAVVWSDHFSLPEVNKAMVEQNFKNTNNIFWYKLNQNLEGTHNLTNAIESYCRVEGRKEERPVVQRRPTPPNATAWPWAAPCGPCTSVPMAPR